MRRQLHKGERSRKCCAGLTIQRPLYSKRRRTELTPGKETLLARKKWVIETLHKQNDPKLFIDQRRNPGTTFDNSCVQKKDLESTDGGDQKAEEVLESVVNDSTVDGEDEKAQSLGMEEAGVKEKN